MQYLMLLAAGSCLSTAPSIPPTTAPSLRGMGIRPLLTSMVMPWTAVFQLCISSPSVDGMVLLLTSCLQPFASAVPLCASADTLHHLQARQGPGRVASGHYGAQQASGAVQQQGKEAAGKALSTCTFPSFWLVYILGVYFFI